MNEDSKANENEMTTIFVVKNWQKEGIVTKTAKVTPPSATCAVPVASLWLYGKLCPVYRGTAFFTDLHEAQEWVKARAITELKAVKRREEVLKKIIASGCDVKSAD